MDINSEIEQIKGLQINLENLRRYLGSETFYDGDDCSIEKLKKYISNIDFANIAEDLTNDQSTIISQKELSEEAKRDD